MLGYGDHHVLSIESGFVMDSNGDERRTLHNNNKLPIWYVESSVEAPPLSIQEVLYDHPWSCDASRKSHQSRGPGLTAH